MISTVTPLELAELRRRGEPIDLIDVRTPAEFRDAHIDFARNVPLDRLDPQALQAEHAPTAAPLYFICRKGLRGQRACEKLVAAGVANVVNVAGGTYAWEAAGLPVVLNKRGISLERQVRITAGSLVLLGAVLGLLVHPYLIGLSAFVGAGLVFAGVTDTCGMGMLLLRMPWNRAAKLEDEAAALSCSARS